MLLWSTFTTWLSGQLAMQPPPIDGYQTSLRAQITTSSVEWTSPSRISGKPAPVSVPAVVSDLTGVTDSGQLNVEVLPVSKLPNDGPSFKPPSGRKHWGGSDFECDYSRMHGYVPCNSENRTCWLRNPETGHEYTIKSNYESGAIQDTPVGVDREYTLVVEDGRINADGVWANNAKLVNGTYPGPWIQACWGDTVKVKVINKLKHNGTAIHFHGIRQLKTMHMDGVPGITQCPIAPNDYFTYEFRVLQYGSSWYHSHYSVQYADGILGPMTLHGPSSADWDEAKLPLLMTDWFHNTAFQVIHGQVPGYATTLLNGTGDITQYVYPERDENGTVLRDGPRYSITPNGPIPAKYTLHFEEPLEGQPKKYVMRLVNTAFASTFLFSIDNHKFTIIGADFVPVWESKPRTHLQVGIGQRYTIIVEAEPVKYEPGQGTNWDPKHPNFWIRTEVVDCFKQEVIPRPNSSNITGVLRYNAGDLRDPVTQPWAKMDRSCRDEVGLEPTLPWQVGKPSNGGGAVYGEEFRIILDTERRSKKFPLGIWSFAKDGKSANSSSLQIDYDDPIFDNLWNLEAGQQNSWKSNWVVIPEDYTEDDWIYLAITNPPKGNMKGAHPIHLHGHDFAVLAWENSPWNPSQKLNLNTMNPMRRDVVLLPKNGWIIIAFKADNPGSWIMHCHIAFHASEGLALQINERQAAADKIWPNNRTTGVYDSAIVESKRICKRWKDFQHDCTQHWPGWNEQFKCWPACSADNPKEKMFACGKDVRLLPPNHVFQDDSGI